MSAAYGAFVLQWDCARRAFTVTAVRFDDAALIASNEAGRGGSDDGANDTHVAETDALSVRASPEPEPEPPFSALLLGRSGDEHGRVPYGATPLALFVNDEYGTVHAAFDSGALTSNEDIAGEVPEGLCAAALSPDGELFVLVARDGSVLTLTKRFDVLSKSAIDDFGDNGVSPSAPPSPCCISWRGDGQFFAVSYRNELGAVRVRVYGRDGGTEHAQCQLKPAVAADSAPLPELNGVIAWQPRRGGFLAAATVAGSVCFFELNGLRHTRMDLATADAADGDESGGVRHRRRVWKLQWSPDCALLAVVRRDDDGDIVDVYAFRNYHWYRKQRFHLPPVADVAFAASATAMSPAAATRATTALTMYIALERCDNRDDEVAVRRYDLAWAVDVSRDERDAVAVIDGARVLVTPLSRVLVPPPMSHSVLALPSDAGEDSVNRVAWDAASGALTAHTARGKQHVFYVDDARPRDGGEAASEAEAERADQSETRRRRVAFDAATGVLRRAADGLVFSRECTSFAQQSRFLLYTTRSDSLVCLDTDDFPLASSTAEMVLRRALDASRPIDHGSVVIAALHDRLRVVLQAPRGNLETVCPRALALERLRALVRRQRDYAAALMLARRQRIEPATIVRLEPAAFRDDVDRFLAQLERARVSTDVLNAFVASLAEASDDGGLGSEALDALVAAMQRAGERRYILPLLTAHCTRKPEPALEDAMRALKRCYSDDALQFAAVLVKNRMDVLYRVALGLYDLELAAAVAARARMDPRDYKPFLKSLREHGTPALARYEIDMYLMRYERALDNLFEAVAAGHHQEANVDKLLLLVRTYDLYERAMQLAASSSSSSSSSLSSLMERISLAYAAHLESAGEPLQAARLYAAYQQTMRAAECYRRAGCGDLAVSSFLRSTRGDGDATARTARVRAFAESVAAEQESQNRLVEAARLRASPLLGQLEEAIQLLCSANEWHGAVTLCSEHARADLLDAHVMPALLEAAQERGDEMCVAACKYRERAQRLQVVRDTKRRLELLRIDDYDHGGGDGDDDDDDAVTTTSMRTDVEAVSAFTFTSRSTGISGGGGSTDSAPSRVSAATSRSNFAVDAKRDDDGSTMQQQQQKQQRRQQQKKKKRVKQGSAHEEEYLVEYLKRLRPSPVLCEAVRALLEYLIAFGRIDAVRAVQRSAHELVTAVDAFDNESKPSDARPAPPPDRSWFDFTTATSASIAPRPAPTP